MRRNLLILPSPNAVSSGLREEILDKIQESQDQAKEISELLRPRVSTMGINLSMA